MYKQKMLNTSGSPIYIEALYGEPLYVIFSGLKGKFTNFHFEMLSTMRKINKSCVILRDRFQLWYLKGLTGKGELEVIDFLDTILKSLKPSRLYFIGTSAGGFAAIKYSKLFIPNKVLAFGPQINITKTFMESIGDNRWYDKRQKIYGFKDKDLVCNLSFPNCIPVDIHICNNQFDIAHAKTTNFNIIEYNCVSHTIAKFLKEEDKLLDIVNRIEI